MPASVQIDVVTGDHHLHKAGIRDRILLQAKTGKEAGEVPGAPEPDFLCGMVLSLEEQEPQDQISETVPAEGFKHTDIPKTIGAVFPPNPPGSGRNAILIYESIPAQGIQIVTAATEDGHADGENTGGKVFTGSEPLSLNHGLTSPFGNK